MKTSEQMASERAERSGASAPPRATPLGCPQGRRPSVNGSTGEPVAGFAVTLTHQGPTPTGPSLVIAVPVDFQPGATRLVDLTLKK